MPVPGPGISPMHPWLDYTCLVASQECKIWRHYDTTTISSIYMYYYNGEYQEFDGKYVNKWMTESCASYQRRGGRFHMIIRFNLEFMAKV